MRKMRMVLTRASDKALLVSLLLGLSACKETSTPTCADCVAPSACINGECVAYCYDHDQCTTGTCCVEGACVAAPDPLGDCPRCGRGEPLVCTNLPSALADLAGVGACTVTERYCLNGEREPCTAGSSSPELVDNGIDDDCDGTVDEGGPCAVNQQRMCHRGFVDTEAIALATGECQNPVDGMPYGRQWCSVQGMWGVCAGDVLPQRAVAPALGFSEAADQCDGLDNDCDGRYDENAEFDADGDGYTVCGSMFEAAGDNALVNTHRLPGVDAYLEDCNDQNPSVHTVADIATRPTCTTLRPATCGGSTGPVWDAIASGDPFDDCGRVSCRAYFYGLVDATPEDELDNKECYYRADISDGDCNGAGACLGAGDLCPTSGKGQVVAGRPVCHTLTAGCVDTTAPVYEGLVPSRQDPYNDCAGELACDGAGACAKIDGETCSDATQCGSGVCADGVCCATTCGTCQRCDVAESLGTCANVSGGNQRGCTGACHTCNNGTCETQTGASGYGCETATTFCCAGACVSASAEYGAACGTDECAGGIWTCDAESAKCTTSGSVCGYCGADLAVNGVCDATGMCANEEPTLCAACRSCVKLGRVAACAGFHPAFSTDTVGPGVCAGAMYCDGNGGCVFR